MTFKIPLYTLVTKTHGKQGSAVNRVECALHGEGRKKQFVSNPVNSQ